MDDTRSKPMIRGR